MGPREDFIAQMMQQGGGGGVAAPPAPGAGGIPTEPPMPPIPAVLDPAMEADLLQEVQADTDPTSQEGEVIFMDPDMLPRTPEKGDKLQMTVHVKSIGSKIGLTPVEVQFINDDENENETGDDGSDDDY